MMLYKEMGLSDTSRAFCCTGQTEAWAKFELLLVQHGRPVHPIKTYDISIRSGQWSDWRRICLVPQKISDESERPNTSSSYGCLAYKPMFEGLWMGLNIAQFEWKFYFTNVSQVPRTYRNIGLWSISDIEKIIDMVCGREESGSHFALMTGSRLAMPESLLAIRSWLLYFKNCLTGDRRSKILCL